MVNPEIETLVVDLRRAGEWTDATIDVNANPALPKIEVWIDAPSVSEALVNVQLSPDEALRLALRLSAAVAAVGRRPDETDQ